MSAAARIACGSRSRLLATPKSARHAVAEELVWRVARLDHRLRDRTRESD
jgi:hypothetical protein